MANTNFSHLQNEPSESELSNNRTTFKQDCSANKNSSDIESFCPFDKGSIPPECTAAQNYSFPIGKPCILIKLNRVSVVLERIQLYQMLLANLNCLSNSLHLDLLYLLRFMAGNQSPTAAGPKVIREMHHLRRATFK